MKVKPFVVALVSSIVAMPACGEVNAVITDGGAPFSEGILNGYYVQLKGETLYVNPFVVGRYISCKDHVKASGAVYAAKRFGRVWVDTNGKLGGMVVVGQRDEVLCQDPTVWNSFKGQASYIVCD